ncbi:hypothetical protein [Saccharopolyspora sp. 6V]|uniref:hypothetical protein n=1 Tax=Saccharopolyspora sp. 6V TaxID=2877239 RepID=UPI001CD25D57|nr:hypothetical protein [Saccharopolyspora sp. 6V]MCA1191615.1 hypothetical protein [Saccharopolyspora sp. 6V]
MSDYPKTFVSKSDVTVQASTPREANDLRNLGYREAKTARQRPAPKPEPKQGPKAEASAKTDDK